jgi:hypothetical protein
LVHPLSSSCLQLISILVLTCAQGEDALEHIIRNVFDLELDNPLELALKKSENKDIHDVIIMSDTIIDSLVFNIEDVVVPLPHYTKGIAPGFQAVCG